MTEREERERRWRMGRGEEREGEIWETNILYKDVEVQRSMAKKERRNRRKRGPRWRWWQMWGALFLLPPATFSTLPVFSSASLIYPPPLLPFELMCHFMLSVWFLFFFLPSLPSVHDVLLCFRCHFLCVYLCEKLPKSFLSVSLSSPFF